MLLRNGGQPMTKHEDLMKYAQSAIDRLFSDRSVPQSETRDALMDLRDDIENKLSMLDSDRAI